MILLRQDDIHRTRGMFLNLPHISDTSGDYMSCCLLGLICSHYFILSRYIDEIGLSDFLAYLQHLKVLLISQCSDSILSGFVQEPAVDVWFLISRCTIRHILSLRL
jgi:hypothetical protein